MQKYAWLFALLMGMLVACRGLWPGASRAGAKATAAAPTEVAVGDAQGGVSTPSGAGLPDYTVLVADEAPNSPVTIGPFPFQIVLNWQPLAEEQPVLWEIEVRNPDDVAHRFEGMEIQGTLATLQIEPVEPNANLRKERSPSGTLRVRLRYGLSLPPGERALLRLQMTTFLGLPAEGVLLFCADEMRPEHCMALPLEVPTR